MHASTQPNSYSTDGDRGARGGASQGAEMAKTGGGGTGGAETTKMTSTSMESGKGWETGGGGAESAAGEASLSPKRQLHFCLQSRAKAKGSRRARAFGELRTSRRNTNMPFFPFTMGQRGGNSIFMCCTREVWKGELSSTQIKWPRESLIAERTWAAKWCR